MGKGGASTIEQACGVKTLVLSHHELPVANSRSKFDWICTNNMPDNNFYLQASSFSFKHIQTIARGKSQCFTKFYKIIYPCKWSPGRLFPLWQVLSM